MTLYHIGVEAAIIGVAVAFFRIDQMMMIKRDVPHQLNI